MHSFLQADGQSSVVPTPLTQSSLGRENLDDVA